MWRWKATCGSLSWNVTPAFSITLFQRSTPLAQSVDVVVAQAHVDGGQRRLVDQLDLAVDQLADRIGGVGELVVVVDARLLEAALDAGIVVVGGVGRDLRAEQVERQREVQVGLLLHGRQVDDAELAHARRCRRGPRCRRPSWPGRCAR